MVRRESSAVLEDELEGNFRTRNPSSRGGKSLGASRNGTWVFLAVLGLFLVVWGAALAFAPEFSWKATKVDRWLTGRGIEHGSLIVAGLFFFGLGLVSRQVVALYRRRPQVEDRQSDLLLVVDQLATDLRQVLTSVLRTSEEVVALSESHKVLVEHQRAEAAHEPNSSQDALFRLAASMDKLHAHLDDRFHSLDVQFRSRFESVANSVHEWRSALETRIAGLEGAQGPMPRSAPPAPEGPAIEFFETIEKLEERRSNSATRSSSMQPERPFPSAAREPLSFDGALPDEVPRIKRRDD